MVGQTNIKTCIMSELNKQNRYKCIKSKQIVSKLIEKLLKYRILIKDILTFLGIDYREASLITLYFVVLGIIIPKIFLNRT